VPLEGYPILGFVVVILQFFAMGHRADSGRAVATTVLFASVAGVVGTYLGPESAPAAIGGVVVVVAPTVAGRIVRREQRQAHVLAGLNRELDAERRLREEAAIGAERARIAQELHDVVGHELTLIAIQAEAAVAALRVSPERVAGPVEAIRDSAHRTLAEVRSVLSLLAPTVPSERTPGESLVEMTDRARAAGIPNTLQVTGAPSAVHGPASLAVGRIVRECLTNAGRHAPGQPVTVCVAWLRDRVDLSVTNPTASRRRTIDGRGLTGIRHRAELLGGTYAATAHDGIFEVRVSLPTPDVR
jgi:signal transduction histidine kinase